MSAIDSNYELLDFGDGRKLERFSEIVLNRPSPAAEQVRQVAPGACGQRSSHAFVARGPAMVRGRRIPSSGCRRSGSSCIEVARPFRLQLEALPSGQVGVFPEQRENWDWIARQVNALNRKRRKLRSCRC